MRQIWVKISYYWFLFMLFIVGLLCGGLETKAATADYTYKQYRVQYYSLATGDSAWTSWSTFGTSSSLSNDYGVSAIATRFGWSSKFQAGTSYRVVIEAGYSPSSSIPISFLELTNFNCYGSTTTGSWSSDASLISTCDFVGISRVTNSNHVKYIFDITPLSTIAGLQFNLYFGGTSQVSSVNVYAKSQITYGEDIGGAIEEQTIIIQEQIDNSTTEIIDAITDNDKVCKSFNVNGNYTTSETNKALNSSGVAATSTSYNISSYIEVNTDTKIYVKRSTSRYACFYNNNYQLISCAYINSDAVNTQLTIPTNAKYFRATLCNSASCLGSTHFIIETCSTGNQSINDTLTDDNVDNPSSSISDMEALLPSNGTITQLIALPLNLYQKVLNSINGTCSSFNLGSLYGTNLIMPCIDLSTYLGNTVWSTIDLIMSGVFVLVIARKMIKAFNSFTFMKEGDVIND